MADGSVIDVDVVSIKDKFLIWDMELLMPATEARAAGRSAGSSICGEGQMSRAYLIYVMSEMA